MPTHCTLRCQKECFPAPKVASGKVWCQNGHFSVPEVVAQTVWCKKECFPAPKVAPGRVWCAERAFPAPEVVGKRIPYSNSVVRKMYMVGNMNAALARENITASAIGMPLDLRNRDASG